MSAGRPAEKQMIAYLLGELPEAESLRLEQSCVDNDSLFEELLAVEAELTDAYVQGNLAGRTREAFEKRLLNSPDGGKAIALSKLITRRDASYSRAATTMQKKETSWSPLAWMRGRSQFLRFPMAAAAILIIGIGLGVLYWKQQTSQVQNPVAQLPQSATLGAKPAIQSPRPVVIATFVISAGGERDAGSVNEIRVPQGADQVRLQVNLPASHYSIYQASLKSVDDKGMRKLEEIEISKSGTGAILFIGLPSSILPEGDSILTVTGASAKRVAPEVIARYFL